jgi:hypothetical protein
MKKTKPKYRIRNWTDYNRSLEQRGSLTVWISDDALENWLLTEKTGNRGASKSYSDLAIQTLATLKAVFHQAGRQIVGFVKSIFKLMKIDLPIPDHSTLSRRLEVLPVELTVKAANSARHIVVDSTGVKVYGEGEWKVRTHGISKRRTWRKLHLCVDEKTHEIIAAAATENSVSDCQAFPALLDAIEEEIEQISADGSYDKRSVYQAIRERGIRRAAIPPRKNARIWQHGNSKEERLLRDENLRAIRKRGRKRWKEDANYHRRSLSETAVFRFKTIFTDKLQSRKIENQFGEMFIKCEALNRMTHLGMPEGYKVTA